MKNSFDYKKAKEEAERMLEVIEREPPKTNLSWAETIQELVPLFYAISISNLAMNITAESIFNILKEDNKA